MSEIENHPIAARATGGEPTTALTPDQTGNATRSGRVARSIGNLDSGGNLELADRFAGSSRDRCVRETSFGLQNESGVEVARGRGQPLGARQVLVTPTEHDDLAATDNAMPGLLRQNAASNTGEATASVGATHHAPLNIHRDKLTPEALARLNTGLRSGTSGRHSPDPELPDEAGQRNLTGQLTGRFLQERAAARTAVEALHLNPAAKVAIVEQVIHDDIPAAWIPAMGRAYSRIGDHIARLGAPLSGRGLQETVRAIRNAKNDAFDEAHLEVNTENQHRAHKMFWRFVLAPGASARAQAIVDQLRPAGSPLRAIGDAATWYRGEYQPSQTVQPSPGRVQRSSRMTRQAPQRVQQSAPRAQQFSPTAQQSTRSVQHSPQAMQHSSTSSNLPSTRMSAFSPESLRAATDYSVMICSLAEVLDEKTGWLWTSLSIVGDNNVPDQTIATLRNLGVPMPAPARLGEQNRKTPISEPALAAIREQFEEHLRIKRSGTLEFGVLAECIRDVRNNTYAIEGRELRRDNETVAHEMQAFCTGRNSGLNRTLLSNLSMLAYRGGFNCVHATCLNNARHDMALFAEEPVITEVEQSHYLSRTESGDVILNSEQWGKVRQLKIPVEHGDRETVDLDPDSSHLRLAIRFRLDGTTGRPALEDVNIDYAFIPLDDGPESLATEDETSSGPEGFSESEDSEDSDSLLLDRLRRLREY